MPTPKAGYVFGKRTYSSSTKTEDVASRISKHRPSLQTISRHPPYLYNMSLLPNTYFFSEMLRSFVQAKAERNSTQLHPPVRKSRKRTWSATRTDCFQKPKAEEKQDTSADWMIKSNRKLEENPLELTMNKPEMNETTYQNKIEDFNTKVDNTVSEPIFPNIHPNLPQDGGPSNLVLPPPPPMWYPPLYPTPPYGIDPLHFFIDLRVSGHIYDRKKQEKSSLSPSETFVVPSNKDKPQHSETVEVKNETDTLSGIFKQPRHCSAFSVPCQSGSKYPINLCEKGAKNTKFDVKSMGFDKNTNKTSTNYIMNNISSIYREVGESNNEVNDTSTNKEETDEEKDKRVKDLRALIGLELVVDYMKQKPGRSQQEDSLSSTDIESIGSPALEVVAVNDDNN
ncbi:hypothetical protein NQ317_019530 [Molorchus minor]|uniref:Uncharacterized protein n=1 Tax=Molorchus minor TaxID=1323400 RepID=A0ABQ9J578_9CUCU|nr:hypothetical protein NQ317_019530 [Molorchus minor]